LKPGAFTEEDFEEERERGERERERGEERRLT
jgi:hypothetical protein